MKRLIFLIFLLLASPCWAANYYVDCAADGDAGAGTSTDASVAWKTINKLNSVTFSAGDNVYFKRGCTWNEQLATVSNGSAGSPITYGAYSTGANPIIDGQASREYGIYVNGHIYNTFQDLKVTRATTANIALYTGSPTNIIIQRCEVSSGSANGIGIAVAGAKSNYILNNFIHDNATNGIFLYKSGASDGISYVRGNIIYNNATSGVSMAIYVWSKYYTIESNTVYNNGNTSNACVGIEVFNGDNDGYGSYNTVRYNLVYGQKSGADNGEGIDFDNFSANNTAYYNVCYGNDGPGFTNWRSNNNSFYNNTSYGNCLNSGGELTSKYEFHVGETNNNEVTNLLVKNNIFMATQANTYAIGIVGTAFDNAGLDITNNIYYAAATNWYYWNDGGGNNLTTWNALTGVGTDINSDPLFANTANNDFKLRSNSPARRAGADVSLTSDFLGRPVPAAPDLGAYQFASPRKPIKLGGKWR